MKKIIFIIALGLVTILFLGCKEKNIGQTLSTEQIKEGIEESKKIVVARVNGAEIKMHNLVREMNLIAPNIIGDKKPSPEITEKIKGIALQRLITKELFIQEARKRGINIPEARINQVIGNIKKLYGSEKAYKDYLKEKGLTEDELKKEIERSHLYELFTAKFIYEKIEVKEEEIKERFERLKNEHDIRIPENLTKARPVIVKMIKAEKGEKILKEIDKRLRKGASIEILLDKSMGVKSPIWVK